MASGCRVGDEVSTQPLGTVRPDADVKDVMMIAQGDIGERGASEKEAGQVVETMSEGGKKR